MEEINKLAINNTEDKKIEVNYNCKLTPTDYMAIESIQKIQNPFKMINVEMVMNDLHICKSLAYRLFQSEDFPSINIGKSKQIMLLPYLLWKMNRRS